MITENTPRGSGGGAQGTRATERTRAPTQCAVRVSTRTARRVRVHGRRSAIIARCQQEGDGAPDEGRVCPAVS
jgi:nitrogen-specific signal transduction histidine kinase